MPLSVSGKNLFTRKSQLGGSSGESASTLDIDGLSDIGANIADADLIIIMTKSETGKLSELFVGSYAEQIVNSSQKTPVMCINPKSTGTRATGGSGFY